MTKEEFYKTVQRVINKFNKHHTSILVSLNSDTLYFSSRFGIKEQKKIPRYKRSCLLEILSKTAPDISSVHLGELELRLENSTQLDVDCLYEYLSFNKLFTKLMNSKKIEGKIKTLKEEAENTKALLNIEEDLSGAVPFYMVRFKFNRLEGLTAAIETYEFALGQIQTHGVKALLKLCDSRTLSLTDALTDELLKDKHHESITICHRLQTWLTIKEIIFDNTEVEYNI